MSIINTFAELHKRAITILGTEGFVPLIKRSFFFITSALFVYETYYVYRHAPLAEIEAHPASKSKHSPPCIIHTRKQADELATRGIDISAYTVFARRHLDRGAIAFCILNEGELIFTGWVAITKEAKKSLTQIPLHADFPVDSAYLAGGWTNPRYRKMGYWNYGYELILKYLREIDMNTAYTIVNTDNSIMCKGINKFAAPTAKGRYLKILFWEFWRQKQIVRN